MTFRLSCFHTSKFTNGSLIINIDEITSAPLVSKALHATLNVKMSSKIAFGSSGFSALHVSLVPWSALLIFSFKIEVVTLPSVLICGNMMNEREEKSTFQMPGNFN